MMSERKQARTIVAGFLALGLLHACSRDAAPPADATAPPPATDTTPRVDFATFHASGELSCTVSASEPIGPCDFGVRREGGGNAIVTVMPPGADTRTIYFENGEPSGYRRSESDAASFEGHRQGRLFVVTIGPERYEIPDIVVFGD